MTWYYWTENITTDGTGSGHPAMYDDLPTIGTTKTYKLIIGGNSLQKSAQEISGFLYPDRKNDEDPGLSGTEIADFQTVEGTTIKIRITNHEQLTLPMIYKLNEAGGDLAGLPDDLQVYVSGTQSIAYVCDTSMGEVYGYSKTECRAVLAEQINKHEIRTKTGLYSPTLFSPVYTSTTTLRVYREVLIRFEDTYAFAGIEDGKVNYGAGGFPEISLLYGDALTFAAPSSWDVRPKINGVFIGPRTSYSTISSEWDGDGPDPGGATSISYTPPASLWIETRHLMTFEVLVNTNVGEIGNVEFETYETEQTDAFYPGGDAVHGGDGIAGTFFTIVDENQDHTMTWEYTESDMFARPPEHNVADRENYYAGMINTDAYDV